jgi:hypothetical protein
MRDCGKRTTKSRLGGGRKIDSGLDRNQEGVKERFMDESRCSPIQFYELAVGVAGTKFERHAGTSRDSSPQTNK